MAFGGKISTATSPGRRGRLRIVWDCGMDADCPVVL